MARQDRQPGRRRDLDAPGPRGPHELLRQRWHALHEDNPACDTGFEVEVDRYSHLGYASGGELGCGGARAIWVKGPTGWKYLTGFQDDFLCESVDEDPKLKKALTVLGLTCAVQGPDEVTYKELGHWPESGQ